MPRFDGLFSTPIASVTFPDAGEAIIAESLIDDGVTKTNQGGWHSKVGALGFCGEAGKIIIARAVELTNFATEQLYQLYGQEVPRLEWTFTAWANINRLKDSNALHIHPGATWSGVYYVDPGKPIETVRDGTQIELHDPNPTRTSGFFPDLLSGRIAYPPRAGSMLLFPSYVPHMVGPHLGGDLRISIAFNMRKNPFP